MNFDVKVLTALPVISKTGFDQAEYCRQFDNASLIVHASSKWAEYPAHGGVLSVKCAFQGVENYQIGRHSYSVSDKNYLIVNKDTVRSSIINSPTLVNSFTVSFAPRLESEMLTSMIGGEAKNLDNSDSASGQSFGFAERLYEFKNDYLVSPAIHYLRDQLHTMPPEEIKEFVIKVLEGLFLTQENVRKEIDTLRFKKLSTRKEIYKRLYRSRDFIWSNFKDNLTLEDIAEVASMNTFYFLREYKKLFHITPHKFLQRLRMEEARNLILKNKLSVNEACQEVGFSDVSSFSKLFKRMFKVNPSDCVMQP